MTKYLFYTVVFILSLQSCHRNESSTETQTSSQQTIDSTTTPKIPYSLQNSSNPVVYDASPTANATAEAQVINIRNEFSRINATASLQTDKGEFTCDAKNVVTYFSEQNQPVKIIIDEAFVGDGKWTSEYYYHDGKVIFIYKVFNGQPPGKPDTRLEKRMYIYQDKVIKYMEDDKTLPCTSECNFNSSSLAYKIYNSKSTGNMSGLCN